MKASQESRLGPGAHWAAQARAACLLTCAELRTNLLNLRIATILLALVALLLLSVSLSASQYRRRLDAWQVNQQAQARLATGGVVIYQMTDGSFFHSVGISPLPPSQRPQAASVLARGLDEELDRPVRVGQRIDFGSARDSVFAPAPLSSADAASTLRFFTSLFALWLTFDVFRRDREKRSVHALLALPLDRPALLIGKALGASLSLLLPALIAYGVAFMFLRFAYGLLIEPADVGRAGLIFLLGCGYAMGFILLGLAVSAATRHVRQSAVLSLMLWVMLVLVLPSGAALAARLIVPTPSYNQLNARLRGAQEELILAERRASPQAHSIFDSPNVRQFLARLEQSDRQVIDEYLAEKSRQIQVARRLALSTPAGALVLGASDVAGTGVGAYQDYIEFFRAGRDEVLDALQRRWDLSQEQGERLVTETLVRVNGRQWQPESLAESRRAARLPALSLAAWLLVTAAIAWLTFRRFKAGG